MKLNLRNNLFRYGKKQYLTFGVVIALIMFDTTVWNLMSMGMFSVDYRFSKENDCQSQVSYVLRDNVTRLEHYSAKNGKFCAAFQELYNEVRANKDVVNSSDAIKQTENKIDDIEDEIRIAQRKLDEKADAYNLAIQEKKGLDLSYTEAINEIKNKEQELDKLNQELDKQKQNFKQLPEFKQLVKYAEEIKPSVISRYEFMERLDMFLSYVFAMVFILVLVALFLFLRKGFIRKEKYIRLLLVNHILLVAFLKIVFITIAFILEILPRTLLQKLIDIFEALHLMALWYYLAIGLMFVFFAGVIHFLQNKSRHKNLYNKVIRGECWVCGARVLNNDYCFCCGEQQMCECPHCKQKTYVKMPYCRFCGKTITDENNQ